MSNPNWIVVEDPTGEWWEGALVEESRCRQLESRGVVLLPVLPDLFKRSGVGGFHKRAWGAGHPLHPSRPSIAAPLMLFVSESFEHVHWAARLALDPAYLERVKAGEKGIFASGFLRFVGDASQSNPTKCTLMPTKEADLSKLDDRTLVEDGFIIRGDSRVNFPGDGHYGFAFYGTALGLRVVWSAVSQAAE